MPILIKGSGGAAASSFGYTEQYDENDTEYVSFVPEDRQIIIKPRDSATNYGLSSITGFSNFCIRVRESAELSHEIMLSWGLGNAIGGRYLYAQWEGTGSPDKATDVWVYRGAFSASYDKATGVLGVSGCTHLFNFHDGAFSLDANVTWEIN